MNNIKYCPFMMISKILVEVTGVSGIRGCTVTVDTKCGEEFCALWNEAQGRCGLACTSQSKHAPISSVADKQHSGLLEE